MSWGERRGWGGHPRWTKRCSLSATRRLSEKAAISRTWPCWLLDLGLFCLQMAEKMKFCGLSHPRLWWLWQMELTNPIPGGECGQLMTGPSLYTEPETQLPSALSICLSVFLSVSLHLCSFSRKFRDRTCLPIVPLSSKTMIQERKEPSLRLQFEKPQEAHTVCNLPDQGHWPEVP